MSGVVNPDDMGHALHVIYRNNDSESSPFIYDNNIVNNNTGIWIDGTDGISITNSEFNDCSVTGIAIHGSEKNLKVKSCAFNNCGIGIEEIVSANGFLVGSSNLFLSNTFYNTKTAYWLPQIDGTVSIYDNTFDYYLSGTSQFIFGLSSNYNLVRNHISAPHANIGFNLGGGGNVYAFANTHTILNKGTFMRLKSKNNVALTDNMGIGSSINLAGIDKHNSYGNEIENHNALAFTTSMSNGRFCNNKASMAGTLFNFRGNCMNTDFSNNEMGKGHGTAIGTGLKVDDVIGTQFHKGNKWNVPFTIEGATNTALDPELSLFSVNPSALAGGDPTFLPNTYSPQNWFFPDISVSNTADCQSTNFQDPSTTITEVDSKVIDGTFNTTPLSNWLADRNLIRKLTQYPSLLTDADAQYWLDGVSVLTEYQVALAEEALSIYYGTAYEADQIRALTETYLSDPQNQQQALLDIESMSTTINNRQPSILSSVNSTLFNISPSNDYEALFQDIYTIYTAHLSDPDLILSFQDVQIISEAANLCPLTYGPSIYIAQSLADQFGISYDEAYCSSVKTRRNNINEVYEAIIYPNPARDFIKVKQVEYATFTLFTTNNQIMAKTNNSTIDVSGLNAGMYILKISKISGEEEYYKVIVQR